MLQLPMQPDSENVRALAQVYREEFTGLTTATVTLAQEPARTVDGVGVEQVYRNGRLLAATAVTTTSDAMTTTFARERRTGSTSTTWTLADAPDTGLELVWKNGTLLDPSVDYAIAGDTITLGAAPVGADVLIAWYPVTATSSSSSSDGTSYTIAGTTLTLDADLTADDVLVVQYPYRT